MPNKISAEVTTVETSWRYFYQNSLIERNLPNATLKAVVPQTMNMLVVQMLNTVAGERVKEIKYPLDWWQAIKERWFPKFILKRFPVKWHTFKIDFLYPEASVREPSPTIAVYDSERSRGFPHFENKPLEYFKDEE